MSVSTYQKLGIDPDKSSVREIFSKIIDNDYPEAFCNIIKDPADPKYVITKHPDGDGSKFIQRVLHYLEIGDETIFQGAVDDAFSMNTGDIAASGFVFGTFFLTDVINIHAGNVPKKIIMKQIALRLVVLFELYRKYGIDIKFLGGETADLPDQTSSIIFDMDIFARALAEDIIPGNVQPGDSIYGFASDGQAAWEDVPNSGEMANGLTMSRIKLMNSSYNAKYPFLCRRDKPYVGRFNVDTYLDELGMTVSEAILSPTRQWAIVIKLIIEELKRRGALTLLHGISMNTGGGAGKIKHVGKNIVYVKEMPRVPSLFELIQRETNEPWRDMYETYNCGVGIDVVGSPEGGILKEALRVVEEKTGIVLFQLGECRESGKVRNEVVLQTPFGCFSI